MAITGAQALELQNHWCTTEAASSQRSAWLNTHVCVNEVALNADLYGDGDAVVEDRAVATFETLSGMLTRVSVCSCAKMLVAPIFSTAKSLYMIIGGRQ